MLTFGLDLYDDIAFDGHNDILMIDGVKEATQSLHILLSTRAGEWFLNLRHGLDYDVFMGEKWPLVEEATRGAFLECLAQEPRIEEVQEMEFEFDGKTRELRVDFAVLMDGRIVRSSMGVNV